MPGIYRKKCKACQHDNHFNSKKCKRCGGALDIASPGRPRGTTASEGYGASGGRPRGTTASEGYGVFPSGGRPKGRHQDIPFNGNIGLPSDWDVSAVNLSPELLTACCQRIKQQRTFDLKPWSSVDGAHTFLVDKPTNMTAAEAPASAYLRAVPNCTLSFQYTERGSSTKERWYCCGHCRNDTVPTEQHVGVIFGDSVSDVKPVLLWDMTMPEPIKALCNKYETGMVSLCGLFSDTVKKASMSQYQHLQGEVNAIKKLDRHYYGLFGFMAVKDSDIFTNSPDPHSSLRIKNAIRWFRANNQLYSSFFAHYETLFRYVKPGFINPALLEEQNIPLERLLESEAAGMAFPLDAKYF